MAPTKALCSERSRDWTTKFDPLGIKVCELTGDTVQVGRSSWGDAKESSIIVTTAEKWDSLTRTWQDNCSILAQIQLFLVDEVHILNESRGSTLEVVISRMKARNESMRFLLVSATVPNIRDIANWICSNRDSSTACRVLEFGEEYRPCKLARFVVGVPRSPKQNEFQYATALDTQLFPVLQQYSVMKPILIFCSTRKGTVTTAMTLLKAYEEAKKRKERLPWVRAPQLDARFQDKRLQDLARNGIGVHHAGLGIGDRRLVEILFLDGALRILIATSTLSVGVNLPAHTVVIRGVKLFQNNRNVEYSDLDIMQMIGRAGRPQFDKDGIAIIMCEPQLVSKYQSLTQGKTILESSLHHNMLEHLNSEIALGTITSSQDAKDWLRGSFLFQRLQQNPDYYAIKQMGEGWKENLDGIILQNIGKLESTNLIQRSLFDSGDTLESTEYGDIMSKFYVRQSTMASIMNLPEKLSLREVLEVIAAAEEFSTLRLRASERAVYNELRTHNDIRFSVPKVEKARDKVFLLLQAVLGNISLNSTEMRRGDTQPQLDALTIFKHAPKLAKVVVEVAITKKLGTQLLRGLEAARCLTAKTWEDRPTVLRQVEQIGEKSLKVLAEHEIATLGQLRQQSPTRIEILLNRKPPFGHEVLASVADIPQYHLAASQISVVSDGGKTPVEVEISVQCSLTNQASATKYKKKPRYYDMTTILTITSDLDFLDFRRTPTKALKEAKTFSVTAKLAKPSQNILVLIASESFAGTIVKQTVKLDVPPSEYPTLNTRPTSSMALDLEEFENDPMFWEIDFSESSDPIQAAGKIHKKEKNTVNRSESTRILVQLPNGKYNHSCADKTKCLHLCCRDGKFQPNGKRGENKKGKQKATNASSCRTEADRRAIDGESSCQPQVSSLEKTQNQPGIRNKLGVRQESLKLEYNSRLNQKRKVNPTFEIQFTEVQLRPRISSNSLDEQPDEDLPSVEELLSGNSDLKPTNSSTTLVTCPDSSSRLADQGLQGSSSSTEPLRKRPRILRSTDALPLSFLSDDFDPQVSSQTLRSPVLRAVDGLVNESPGRSAASFMLGVVDHPVADDAGSDTNPIVAMTEGDHMGTADKEWADLDEWLNSGFVETN
ncbi:hypothetical protein D9756_001436 [Leucocoprinus leucothites]|uniref:DNA 3'-5' helicase n=1 Tax=Leucocoprinus leucothites TaxID=201217 RepID=A0A8H5LI57_9AGAR|nr:hypothetical protein D9756_001436 [Leucoagaricus leucothites]